MYNLYHNKYKGQQWSACVRLSDILKARINVQLILIAISNCEKLIKQLAKVRVLYFLCTTF